MLSRRPLLLAIPVCVFLVGISGGHAHRVCFGDHCYGYFDHTYPCSVTEVQAIDELCGGQGGGQGRYDKLSDTPGGQCGVNIGFITCNGRTEPPSQPGSPQVYVVGRYTCSDGADITDTVWGANCTQACANARAHRMGHDPCSVADPSRRTVGGVSWIQGGVCTHTVCF